MIGLGSQYLTAAGFGRYRITAASLGNLDLLGTFGWLKPATKQAILGAFGDDGMAVIKATNAYLNGIAASDRDKATALADLINEDPMMVCSLGLEPQGVTMPIRSIYPVGNAYIDTGIIIDADDEITLDMTSISNTSNYALFGASNGNAYNQGEVALFWNAGQWDGVYPTSNSGSNAGRFGTYAANTKYQIKYTKSSCVCGTDVQNWASSFYQSYQGVRSVYLFAVHRSSSIWYGVFNAHRFGIKGKWDGVPFKHKVGDTTVNCMLDMESMQLFYNAGTGSFTIPDISYTPSTP